MQEVIGLVIVVVLMVAGLAISAWRWRAQREQAAADLAALEWLVQQRNWTYKRTDTGSVDRFAGHFPFPAKSFNASGRHLITGMHRRRPFCAFEYAVRTNPPGMGTGRPSTTTRREPFLIVAVATPAHRPLLAIAGRHSGATAGGGTPVQTGHEQFDRAFTLSTGHEQFARDLLHAQLLRWLLGNPITHQIPFRFERNELVGWQPGRLDARKLEPILDMLCDVLDRVPSAVWR